uniref:Uncharacterized protein n=1 Tax=Arundo donax TaxID=35708 RepID=A0A0A8Y631_ARUDO
MDPPTPEPPVQSLLTFTISSLSHSLGSMVVSKKEVRMVERLRRG